MGEVVTCGAYDLPQASPVGVIQKDTPFIHETKISIKTLWLGLGFDRFCPWGKR